mgnify:CR=1 FL=1
MSATPVIQQLRVIPVAGRDSMLLNLSGAHAPFFTRNLLILTDSAGRTGVGEVPGGESIRRTLEDARELVVGATVVDVDGVVSADSPPPLHAARATAAHIATATAPRRRCTRVSCRRPIGSSPRRGQP